MDTTNKRSTTENVPLVVISPNGTTYIQGSLRQCASFFSELTTRLTGQRKRYFDYKLIRNRLDFDGGEFSGPLSGWKIVEFTDFTSLRSHLWDRDGVPSQSIRIDEPLNDGMTEGKKDGITEDLNNRIQVEPDREPNVTSDWSQSDSKTETNTETKSTPSVQVEATTFSQKEWNLLWNDV